MTAFLLWRLEDWWNECTVVDVLLCWIVILLFWFMIYDTLPMYYILKHWHQYDVHVKTLCQWNYHVTCYVGSRWFIRTCSSYTRKTLVVWQLQRGILLYSLESVEHPEATHNSWAIRCHWFQLSKFNCFSIVLN